MGIVAPSAHHSGSTKSATKPNSAKMSQKIFRSTALKSNGLVAGKQLSEGLKLLFLPDAYRFRWQALGVSAIGCDGCDLPVFGDNRPGGHNDIGAFLQCAGVSIRTDGPEGDGFRATKHRFPPVCSGPGNRIILTVETSRETVLYGAPVGFDVF